MTLEDDGGTSQLDIGANRVSRKWTRRELAGRVAWTLCEPLFRFSPRLAWGWRRWILRRFGAQIGRHVHIHPSVRIFTPWNLAVGDDTSIGFDTIIYNLGAIEIGQRTTVSQRSHLCGGSHDFRDPTMPLLKLPITIEGDVWVCADAFVGPGVKIGRGAVVGARAVVTRNVAAWTIVAGNPAGEKGKRSLAKPGLDSKSRETGNS